MPRQHVCSYATCRHATKAIDGNDLVCDDSGKIKKYYHKDCWSNLQDLKEINRLWHDNIDERVNYGYLNRIVNELIDRGYASNYILFAIQDAIRRKILKYPPGIRYIVSDNELEQQWKKKKAKQEIKDTGYQTQGNKQNDFTFVNEGFNGFLDIFGGE